jgi:hypothetical protein
MKDLKGVKAKLRELLGGEIILNTDEYTIYEGIAEKIEWIKEHRVVNHSRGEWASGEAHVNGCENRKGFLRTYLSKHRRVSKEYLQGYLDFLSLLMNERGRWFALLISDYLKA